MRKFGGKGCVPGFCKVASVRYKPVFKGHTIMVDVVNRGSAVAHEQLFEEYIYLRHRTCTWLPVDEFDNPLGLMTEVSNYAEI